MTTINQQVRSFIAREVSSKGETKTGTVLTPPKLKAFGAAAAPVWVVDVAIGSNRPLKDVPIKAGSDGSRFFADLGQSVKIARQAGEKFQVIGPGDRIVGLVTVKTYTVGDINPLTIRNEGQVSVKRPYSFYKGGLPGIPNSGLYGTAGYPKIETVDGDGNVI